MTTSRRFKRTWNWMAVTRVAAVCLFASCLNTSESRAYFSARFKDAAAGSDAVVLARFTEASDLRYRFEIVEVVRGSFSLRAIDVPRSVWTSRAPLEDGSGVPAGIYLLLLTQDGSLYGDTLSGLPIQGDKPISILPIRQNLLPGNYRRLYDSSGSTEAIPLETITRDLRKLCR
jgi:hypothetical protein